MQYTFDADAGLSLKVPGQSPYSAQTPEYTLDTLNDACYAWLPAKGQLGPVPQKSTDNSLKPSVGVLSVVAPGVGFLAAATLLNVLLM